VGEGEETRFGFNDFRCLKTLLSPMYRDASIPCNFLVKYIVSYASQLMRRSLNVNAAIA